MLDTFAINHEFKADLVNAICRRRAEYACEVDGYRRLFAAIRPKAVLIVQNGVEKALFHTARELGILTIEAQHGLIGHGHPAYSYPPELNYSKQTAFPDIFLTFTTFWQTTGFYPAQRLEVVGSDHFAKTHVPLRQSIGTIMIISANIYHQELLELTKQIAAQLPDRGIIYKLHPNQAAEASSIRDALNNFANVTVGDPVTPAASLLEEVSHIVAIQSTVVYEALQYGRKACILPRHDYQIHADIFGVTNVAVPESLEHLIEELTLPCDDAPSPVFFDKFDRERMLELTSNVLAEAK